MSDSLQQQAAPPDNTPTGGGMRAPAVPDQIIQAVDDLLEQANIEMGRIPDTRKK